MTGAEALVGAVVDLYTPGRQPNVLPGFEVVAVGSAGILGRWRGGRVWLSWPQVQALVERRDDGGHEETAPDPGSLAALWGDA